MNFVESIISTIILLPLLGGSLLLVFPFQRLFGKNLGDEMVKFFGLTVSLITFFYSIFLWINFDNSSGSFQFLETFNWFESYNFYVSFGVDGISLFFVLLTTLLTPICLLASWSNPNKKVKEYFAAFLLMESFILVVFTVLDLLVFYVFFESVLIPMFVIIGVWGSRARKVRASYLFFLYTLLGSVLMLLGVLLIYFDMGTTDYQILIVEGPKAFSENRQYLLWLAFFASFAVKVPMLPVHVWLPEAHVEAPTAGSVILAGILLKLGTYGLVRFSIPLFPVASNYFVPLVYGMAIVAVIYTSLTAIRQTDMKRIIAYASVAHMNMTLIGLFSFTPQGVEGSILQMLSHGLISGALFLCVGVLYDRYHSRLVKYYSGMASLMPVYITIFLFFTMGNIALPGTSSFVGEFMILVGAFQKNTFATFMGATSMVLGGAYSLWLFNRVAYGNLKTQYIREFYISKKDESSGGSENLPANPVENHSPLHSDLNRREFYCFLPLVILTLIMGIYPEIFLAPMHVSCENLIALVKG